MIAAIVRAARAGVRVDQRVRGVCCQRPGVPGATEGVTVRSVVGRLLEHSRIFWFRYAGAEQVYLGSADLMNRNLDRRVEVLFPVEDRELVRHLRDDVLELYLRDDVRTRRMRPDGGYERLHPAPGAEPVDVQAALLARATRRGR
jgi:polyphosphate kinase